MSVKTGMDDSEHFGLAQSELREESAGNWAANGTDTREALPRRFEFVAVAMGPAVVSS